MESYLSHREFNLKYFVIVWENNEKRVVLRVCLLSDNLSPSSKKSDMPSVWQKDIFVSSCVNELKLKCFVILWKTMKTGLRSVFAE